MYNIDINNLSFSYNQENNLILKDINLKVNEGEFICILGQSGCGKSTLLRLLAGLEKPTSGNIRLGDKYLEGASLERSVVFQDYGLFPWMTAGENILLALTQKYPKEKKRNLKNIVYKALNDVGLDKEVYNKFPKDVSGGMKQRCAIARAFSIDSPILLMDEPFGALDAVTRARLQDMVLQLWAKDKKKKTVFFVTHDVDEALLLGSKICVLGQSPSQIIFEGENVNSQHLNRECLYENQELIDMRNLLIKYIHQDVTNKYT